jgi:hypothetical protein
MGEPCNDERDCTQMPWCRINGECQRAATPAPQGSADTDAPKFTLPEVVAFLCGEAKMDDTWFGEPHHSERGMYWWRKHLRAAASSAGGVGERDAPSTAGVETCGGGQQ